MCARLLSNNTKHVPAPPPHSTSQMSEQDCTSLLRKEIEEKLKRRNMPTYGKNKAELCTRLLSKKKAPPPPIPPTHKMRKEDCLRLLRKEIVEKLKKHKLSVSGPNKDVLCRRLVNNV